MRHKDKVTTFAKLKKSILERLNDIDYSPTSYDMGHEQDIEEMLNEFEVEAWKRVKKLENERDLDLMKRWAGIDYGAKELRRILKGKNRDDIRC